MFGTIRSVFTFPDTVDDTSARLVATGVVAQAVVFAVFREGWLLVPLVYGFAARVAAGPTLSPLAQLVTRVISPRVPGEHRAVPGPPKRFAQAIGLVVSGGAVVAWLAGAPIVTFVLLALLLVAAGLEAFAGLCLGCVGYRMIRECNDCDDIGDRLRRALAAADAEMTGARR